MTDGTARTAPHVSLRPVSRANVLAVCALRLADDQEWRVAPASYTVAEAHYAPRSILRAIYVDDNPVGLLFVEVEGGVPYLHRFMVDAAHQGRGVGRSAVALLLDELRSHDWPVLETSYVPGDGGADGFWRSCGFIDTQRRTDEDEPVLELRL